MSAKPVASTPLNASVEPHKVGDLARPSATDKPSGPTVSGWQDRHRQAADHCHRQGEPREPVWQVNVGQGPYPPDGAAELALEVEAAYTQSQYLHGND